LIRMADMLTETPIWKGRIAASRKTVLRWAWALAAAIIAVGSLLPRSSPAVAALDPVDDWLLHFGAYALLAFLPTLHEERLIAAALAVTSGALGAVLEFAQRHVPGRDFELIDVASNVAGVICGVALGCAALRVFANGRLLWSRARNPD